MNETYENILAATARLGLTPRTGKEAYRTLAVIQGDGIESAQKDVSKSTWVRHMKVLREAGVTDQQLQKSNVEALPLRPITLRGPMTSWDDLSEHQK